MNFRQQVFSHLNPKLGSVYYGSFRMTRLASMITVVELRAKQATRSRYMPTDKSYDNYFFIEIDLDWLEPAKKIGRNFRK